MAHPLDSPRAKIGRAEQHLEQFDAARSEWLESSPYHVLTYSDPDGRWKFALHRFDDAVQPERDIFGLIIGDYVHALRSALDHLVWALATGPNGKQPTPDESNQISFPIVTSHPKDYWAKAVVTKGWINFEQALFLEGFQPYRTFGGPSLLGDLHTLWNADKHKVITPIRVTLSKTSNPVIEINDARVAEGPEWDTEIALEGDAEIGWIRIEPIGPNPQVNVNELPVDVAFGEGGRTIESLPALRTIASDIIENCARFFD